MLREVLAPYIQDSSGPLCAARFELRSDHGPPSDDRLGSGDDLAPAAKAVAAWSASSEGPAEVQRQITYPIAMAYTIEATKK